MTILLRVTRKDAYPCSRLKHPILAAPIMSAAAAWQVSSSVGCTALRGATPRTVCKAAAVAPIVSLGRSQAGSNRLLARSALFASSFVPSSEDLRAGNVTSAQRREFGDRVGVKTATTMAASSAYDFSVKDIDGKETDLSKFKVSPKTSVQARFCRSSLMDGRQDGYKSAVLVSKSQGCCQSVTSHMRYWHTCSNI